MKFNSHEFSSWCFDEAVRVACIIPLGCCHDGTAACEELEEFYEDADPSDLRKMFNLPKPDPDDEQSIEGFMEMLGELATPLFLVRVERAVRRFHGKSASFSWGMFEPHWMLAPALDETMVSRIQHWAMEGRKRDKKDSAKAKS